MTDKSFLGFDVSKDDIAAAFHGAKKAERIPNTPEAIKAWLASQNLTGLKLAAFEPTGGYEWELRRALRDAGLPFAKVHPNEVGAHRTSLGIKAKTDDLDALVIADFAAEKLARRGLGPMVEGNDMLRELTVRRRQLADMLHAEKCRLKMAKGATATASIETIAAILKAGITEIEKEIAGIIASDEKLAVMSKNLRSLKGVGPITVYTMLAELPELGCFDNKDIASLVGLAPKTRKSGRMTFRARIGHGRPGVRKVLFNAARCAIKHNPVMREFYDRLVTKNKCPGKVALIAVMRKMLVILNAIAREAKPWKHKIA